MKLKIKNLMIRLSSVVLAAGIVSGMINLHIYISNTISGGIFSVLIFLISFIYLTIIIKVYLDSKFFSLPKEDPKP